MLSCIVSCISHVIVVVSVSISVVLVMFGVGLALSNKKLVNRVQLRFLYVILWGCGLS